MGYELYREVKVWAPNGLTKGEKLVALVLADNANDRTRVTHHSVVDPEILDQAEVPDDRSMRRIMARLQELGIVEHFGGGHNGRTAKFKFKRLAPKGWVGTSGIRTRKDVAGWKTPANTGDGSGVAGAESPGNEPSGADDAEENHPPTEDVAGWFSASSRVKTTRPRPPTNQTTPTAPPDPSATDPEDGGGGGLAEAEAFLQSLPGKLAPGRATARKLAPLLLEAIEAQGWELDDALVAKLTEDRGPISRPAGALKFRIEDLPKKSSQHHPAAPQPIRPLPPWCGDLDCDEETRLRYGTVNGLPYSGPCHCHPDHQKGAA